MPINKIFVYGTLLNKDILKNRWRILPLKFENAAIHGSIYNCGWFPMFLDEGEDTIFGKLITIEGLEDFLPKLDHYENCNNSDPNALYHRFVKEVTLENGTKEKAWVYVGNKNARFVREKCIEENKIKSGQWKEIDAIF